MSTLKLVIEEYWNKVEADESAPFGTKILPEYELKSRVTYPNAGGWTMDNWEKSVKGRCHFLGFDNQGRAKFDLGTSYGINSYQLVGFE